MTYPDFNLLPVLAALLQEGSVTGAARRLGLSASAMSRALARLREATGDPLLVRAGRGLVPTPRAIDLSTRVGTLVDEVTAALRPAETVDVSQVRRTFTFRNREGFVESFGARLVERIAREAPGITLRFVAKQDRDSATLRDGTVDLETGVVGERIGPEMRAQALFRDRFVGVVREGHPLASGTVSAETFAAGRHVLVSRRGQGRGRIDDALANLGLSREIAVVVSSFSEAIALARHSDLIASVPDRYTAALTAGLTRFALPVEQPEITISLLWHPRMEADPAHRWLRGVIREVCREGAGPTT